MSYAASTPMNSAIVRVECPIVQMVHCIVAWNEGPCSVREIHAMAISVVRLGTPRHRGEGLRLGTVRRPPRGVPKAEFATRDFYDVWLPELSPSQQLVSFALGAEDAKSWKTFERKYRAE